MLGHTLERFAASGLPYVVENVQGAAAGMPGAFKLCGSMFDITDDAEPLPASGRPWLLRRHRLMVSNMLIMAPGPCRCHGRDIIGVYGDLTSGDRRCAGRKERRHGRPNGDMRAGVDRARRLMGMPWASAERVKLAIPTEYSRYVGEQLLDHVRADP